MEFVLEDPLCAKAPVHQVYFMKKEASDCLKCKRFSFADKEMQYRSSNCPVFAEQKPLSFLLEF